MKKRTVECLSCWRHLEVAAQLGAPSNDTPPKCIHRQYGSEVYIAVHCVCGHYSLFIPGPPPSEMDLGRERFAWLLQQRGMPFLGEDRIATELGVSTDKKPDFLVSIPGFPRFLVEVEGFLGPGPLATRTARSYYGSADEMQRKLGTAVKHAANQLKPYRGLSIPMLIVLDDARRVGIALQKVDLENLFGSQVICQPINVRTGEVAGAPYITGDPKSFHVVGEHYLRHVSAIAVNLPKEGFQYEEALEKERPMRLRILYNPHADVRFPLRIFDDPEDEHIWRTPGGDPVPA